MHTYFIYFFSFFFLFFFNFLLDTHGSHGSHYDSHGSHYDSHGSLARMLVQLLGRTVTHSLCSGQCKSEARFLAAGGALPRCKNL